MGWAYVFKTYWFDAHTAMPREGTTVMTSRKDVTNVSLLPSNLENLTFIYKKATQSERPRG